ncbi:carbohydrate ABC transporter permease [Chelatococcus asaccharovorans]|uniref:Carbohydrate ABC transporter membrane protein 2 (CUT1 family) n=1 Tax=Chelatococcus asaccharovorans TaxID=28210 RepID=A0A2V3UIC4_9HYPH|nr:carbohydrate ABC transporter permease [Chelatococcus asaccharovorans]MBS7706299.1 carbohydrate ABC transporter permease [Chelatococcus asaccharovorans]PXW65061.1 carbohydrate ABC transporter membrane protein 2 (CUT1 family) [Chelatococcus asaccharovorans]CAH1660905.1 Carbohydrate ABC transporter membrane protein 2 (CUT1 family) [Chelatococcus asaccharovorans]CAH1683629.1 Carbohydrate ABC transporter membrane protein 2 (CUT1 family) [Chelatococcus asaccharovorans]
MIAARAHHGSAALRHVVLIASSLFILMPFVWMVSLSIKSPQEAFQQTISLIPSVFYGHENYQRAFVDVPLLRFMGNGLLICISVLVIQLAIAAPSAYALAKLEFRGRDAIFAMVLVGLLIPHQVLAIPLFILFNKIGILNSYASLILPGVISPFGIFLLRQFFKAVPDDLIHAARLDGLSELSIVWRIMVPSSMSAVIAFSILSVVSRWNDLFLPLIFIQDQQLLTPPAGIMLFRSEEAGNSYGPLMAAATLIVAPLLIAFLIAQRRFIEGLTVSGLK